MEWERREREGEGRLKRGKEGLKRPYRFGGNARTG